MLEPKVKYSGIINISWRTSKNRDSQTTFVTHYVMTCDSQHNVSTWLAMLTPWSEGRSPSRLSLRLE